MSVASIIARNGPAEDSAKHRRAMLRRWRGRDWAFGLEPGAG
jgi:hypothetical protein